MIRKIGVESDFGEKKMTQNSFEFISSAISDRGLSEKRPQNEDSYLEMPERGLFSVADGVGGAQAGDVASQMAMEILCEAFTNSADGGDVEGLMEEAISRANGAIYQMSHDLPQLSTMATTIVALQITDNVATIAHAGDSRLYRLDVAGNLFRETQDHSVVEEEVRAGRMTREQAEYHPSRNVISRALGAEQVIEIDVKTMTFEPGSTFLLCSDGITRHIPDAEIRDLLSQPGEPVEICVQMKEICYSRGAEDNLTAVIVKIAAMHMEKELEVEEVTVATARVPLVESTIFSENEQEYDDNPTQNLQFSSPGDVSDITQEIIVPVEEAAEVSNASPSSSTDQIFGNYSSGPTSDDDEAKSGGGLIGKVLTAFAWLIIGGLAGAAGLYFYLASQAPKEIPQITQSQSPNIPYTSFEDSRRAVYKNPGQFITTSEPTADDAEDYFLLGRAYSLTGKYPEAKAALAKARERLAQTKTDDKTMLAKEIAAAMAAIENPKVFEAEMQKSENPGGANSNVARNSSKPPANANTNANTNSTGLAGK